MADDLVLRKQEELKVQYAEDIKAGKLSIRDLKVWYKENSHKLSPEDRTRLAGEIKALEKNKIDWKPFQNVHDATQPSNQELACESLADELLYGGGAGGGKTGLLLGLAGTRHRKSLLLRRTFPDVENSLLANAERFYGNRKGNYNATTHVWKIGTVKRVKFGHVNNQGTPEHPGDEEGYSGGDWDLIGFDELQQFSRFVYEFILTRARSTIKTQRVRVISTANPVGEGVDWIIDRWAAWLLATHPNPAKPGELRWYAQIDNRDTEVKGGTPFTHRDTLTDKDEVIYPKSRTFIPSLLVDNPYLGTDYLGTLQGMREPWRSQLLHGDWKAAQTDDPYQIIPRAWVEAAMARWTEDGRPADTPMTAMGMDISRGGDDKTVYAPRYENWYDKLTTYPGNQITDGLIAAEHAVEIVENKSTVINGDVIGWGSGACEHLRLVLGYNVKEINFGEASNARDPSGKFKYQNKRAQYYFEFAEKLDPHKDSNIALPPDPELKRDLCAVRYKQDGSWIRCEDKLDIRKRIAVSPDKGDAAVLASIEVSMPGFRTLG